MNEESISISFKSTEESRVKIQKRMDPSKFDLFLLLFNVVLHSLTLDHLLTSTSTSTSTSTFTYSSDSRNTLNLLMEYQPIRPSGASQRIVSDSSKSESIYWRKFKSPVFFKHDGPINSIDYVSYHNLNSGQSSGQLPPSAKHQYAISSSSNLFIYNARNQKQKKKIARFKEVVSSVGFRPDGKLIAAGDHAGLVQVSAKERTQKERERGRE